MLPNESNGFKQANQVDGMGYDKLQYDSNHGATIKGEEHKHG